MNSDFDVVIIGSGLGGLCCGALLANAGLKVVVLEQHSKIGGYAHNFKRRQFTFESGIHSVPMSKNGVVMSILRLLKIDSCISPVEHSSMYTIRLPHGSFTMPSKSEEIDDFFRKNISSHNELLPIYNELDRFHRNICIPIIDSGYKYIEENTAFVSKFHNYSYYNHIQSLCNSREISNLIFGQWPYSGIVAESAGALFSFTMFMLHYKEGSHYCKGGFSKLAQAFADKISAHDGVVLTKKRVNRCIVENNLVTKVTTTDGSVFDTKRVISNISPYSLHYTLLQPEYQGKMINRRLANLNPSVSCVIVYLGMNPGFKPLLTHGISFWYESEDYNHIYHNILHCKNKDHIDHLVTLCGIDDDDFPTVTLMYFARKNLSDDWHSDKMYIAQKMISKLEQLYPGIKNHIEIMEVGSPETFERFTANTNGALYGFENVKEIYGEAKMPINTHLPNLFQTGHWGKPGGGVWNVLVNAFNTSKLILNRM